MFNRANRRIVQNPSVALGAYFIVPAAADRREGAAERFLMFVTIGKGVGVGVVGTSSCCLRPTGTACYRMRRCSYLTNSGLGWPCSSWCFRYAFTST
uniref:Uncharacterized protein n=1 Tax=Anopheles aquasalis TaxID=42839 RepID=T1E7I1_ANOAQ